MKIEFYINFVERYRKPTDPNVVEATNVIK